MRSRRLLVLLALSLVVCSGAAHAATPVNGRIVFGRNVAGVPQLFSANADGTEEVRLTWTPATTQQPAWSPDGTRIVYASNSPSGGPFRIWLMNADGSGQTQLTPDGSSSVREGEPAWSPDGTQIAFDRDITLYVMNADGSGIHKISDVLATEPTWSPDGTQLAYAGADGIGVVGVDGSNPHTVTAPGAYASGPAWSPDGSEIVFSRNRADGYPGELYIANADGSGERRLTSGGYENALPSWSPDGTRIVFERDGNPAGWHVWSIALDGTGLRQVTTSEGLDPDWGTSQAVPSPSPPDAPTIRIYSPTEGQLIFPGSGAPAFYECTSFVSPVMSCSGDIPVGAPLDLSTAGWHTFTVRATDFDGRTSSSSVRYYVPDFTAPTIDVRAPRDGARYDLGATVLADYSCSDPGGLGVVACFGDRASGMPLDTSTAGAHSLTVSAFDAASNQRTVTVTYTVVAPPQIRIDSPASGAALTRGSVVNASYSCWTQAAVKLASCTGSVASGTPLDTGSVGQKALTVTAVDEDGRTTTVVRTYSVVYAFSGFDPPVDASGLLDGAKAGEPLPLKFSLKGDAGSAVVAQVTSSPASCLDWSSLGSASTAQGRLAYTAAVDRYTELVATDPAWKNTCRLVDLALSDGTRHLVKVRFAKA